MYLGGSENRGIRAPLPIPTPFSQACHEEEARLEKAIERDVQIVQWFSETDKHLCRPLLNDCVSADAHQPMIENKGCRSSPRSDPRDQSLR